MNCKHLFFINNISRYNKLISFFQKYDESRYPNNNSIVPYEEFLVYCRVYEPFERQNRPYKLKAPVVKLKSVISILGYQTLYELRQKIICQSDLSITTDTSNKSNRHKLGSLAKVTVFFQF